MPQIRFTVGSANALLQIHNSQKTFNNTFFILIVLPVKCYFSVLFPCDISIVFVSLFTRVLNALVLLQVTVACGLHLPQEIGMGKKGQACIKMYRSSAC